jgi:phenazine biosynthesis protein phzE
VSDTLLSLLFEEPERLGAFMLLARANDSGARTLEIHAGDVQPCSSLGAIPPLPAGQETSASIAIIPYRQLIERNYACVDDGEPLLVLQVASQQTVMLDAALRSWPEGSICVSGGGFDIDDPEYVQKARDIIANEIGSGEGSNFVLKRTFEAELPNYSLTTALTAFRRLVSRETGAYWTFLVHTGERTLIGASPERHVSLKAGKASMNPISGTYRYPESGPTLKGVLEFLGDRKEADELYMVVDEELKMMARFCKRGAKVVGPRLKQMSRLAHTEYVLEGETDADPRDILRETLFSPAVTGSPLENACHVIEKYEPEGRRYYAGVLALLSRDSEGRAELDSTILIRTADIDCHGTLRISVGATIVRHSDPASEAAETRAKALAVLSAFNEESPANLAKDPAVVTALQSRNQTISRFWQSEARHRDALIPGLAGKEVLIVDAEDAFTAMLGQQLSAMGLKVRIAPFHDRRVCNGDWDVAVFGPGPGDPHNTEDTRIRALRCAIADALGKGKPFFAVCLSHQLLCLELGLPVLRRPTPNQGVQREIDYFGTRERVGFYNTFSATSSADELWHRGEPIEVCRDRHSNEVHALRGRRFSSIQFHAESVLTQNGINIISQALQGAKALHLLEAS